VAQKHFISEIWTKSYGSDAFPSALAELRHYFVTITAAFTSAADEREGVQPPPLKLNVKN